jgi:hypothetical protein
MVKEGRLERRTLERIKRLEAAHANSVKRFTLFVGGVLCPSSSNLSNLFHRLSSISLCFEILGRT